MTVEGQGLCPEGHTEAPRRPVELVRGANRLTVLFSQGKGQQKQVISVRCGRKSLRITDFNKA